MKVLVACECSGVVRDAFMELGHEAYSCDKNVAEPYSPFHLMQDVSPLLQDTSFDLLIAHPPCTHLCVSGAKHFNNKKSKQQSAIEFFMLFVNSPIRRKVI